MASNTSPSNANHSTYNYVPTFSVGIVLLSLFAVTTALHVGQAVYHRSWWLFATIILCGIGEILGWSARVWSSKAPDAQNPFLMQITTTIISPTFLLAANFVVTGRLIGLVGPQYIQAVGGAKASSASSANNSSGAKEGGNIMLGGIVFQLAALTLYSILTTEFLVRYVKKRPFLGRESTLTGPFVATLDTKLKLMLVGVGLSSLFVFIRAIYRTIELSNGWSGRIISTERYFVILDGGMIFLAMATLNVLHPGALMQDSSSTLKGADVERKASNGSDIARE